MPTPTQLLAQKAIARATRRLPALRPARGPVRRSIKCVLAPATFDGRPVVVKAITSKASVWSWYLRREQILYERFASDEAPPIGPVNVPRLVGVVPPHTLVLEQMPGAPLAAKRHDRNGLPVIDDATWTFLLAMLRALRGWSRGLTLAPREPPDARSLTAMRSRLLEDPCAPLEWMTDGIARAARRGVIERGAADIITRALEDHPVTCFSHGDLLLRNIVRNSDSDSDNGNGQLALVDWECAGEYLVGWDAALLWIWAPPAVRRTLREEHARDGKPSLGAFLACVAFALVREIAFRSRTGKSDPVLARLEVDLRDVIRDLLA